MTVDKLKQAIKEQEVSVEDQLQGLQSLRIRIVDEIKPFAKAFLKDAVEQKVKSNPNHTKELGVDALAAMKQRMLTSLEHSDELVDAVFSDDALWVHFNYRFNPQNYNSYKDRAKAEDNILVGIRRILGEAGQILFDNKYIQIGYEYIWDTQHPYDILGVHKSKLMHGPEISIPRNISVLIDEYCNKLGDLIESYKKLYSLQKSLSEQEAADLWGSL